MRRKLFGATTLIGAAAVALVGCSSSSSGGTAVKTDAAGDKVTLNLWMWSGAPAQTAMQTAIDAYQKLHPNVTIKDNVISNADFKQKVPLALNSGQQIDILAVQPNLFADQIRPNLRPLSDWEKYLPAGTMDKFTPLALDQSKKLFSDNTQYVVPLAQSGSAVGYYNVDLLTKYGLSVPKTWDDVKNIATVLKAKAPDITPVVMPAGGDAWFQDEFVLTLAGQTDPQFFDKVRYDNGKWDSPAYVSAVQYYQKLYADGTLSKNQLDVGYGDAMNEFYTGKAAIAFNGSWESTMLSPDFRAANKISVGDVGVMPVPAMTDPSTRSARSFLDVTLGLPKSGEHVNTAADFIGFVSAGDGVNEWAKSLGEIPSIQGWTIPAGVLTSDAATQGFSELQTLIAKPASDRNNLSAFSDQVGKALLQVANGADPADAVKQMQNDLDSGKYN